MFLKFVCFLIVYTAGSLYIATGHEKFVLLSVNGTILNGTRTKNRGHVQQLTVNLTTSENENFILDMHLNIQLISSKYAERVVGASNISQNPFNHSSGNCYYIGEVRGYPGSSASLTTCRMKIDGFFIVNNRTYDIHPEPSSKYLTAVREANENHNKLICGVNGVKQAIERLSKRSASLSSLTSLKEKRNKIVELYVAGDALFLQGVGTREAAFGRIKSIVNAADALYNSVGIYLVLVGSEVWDSQQFTVYSNISLTLENWYKYKADYLNGNVTSHDNAALISGQKFDLDIVGLATMGSMCDSLNSGAVVEDDGKSIIAYPAAILTHEMGHNFGLTHDDSCVCSDAACIMKTSLTPSSPPTKFSSCSLNEFANNWVKGYDLCLWNIPDIVASSTCGNGVVEDGETCDCGGLPSDVCNPSCCNKATCQLVSSYQCASGLCCDLLTCKFYQANTVCRGASNTCDIQELCGGTSAYCPEDTYKHDGTQCAVDGVTAYCSEGKCRTRDTQCALVWGSGVKSSPESCYTTNNERGDSSGNCRQTLTSIPTYYPCVTSDVLCGQLFCDSSSKNGNTQLRSKLTGYISFNGITCNYASLNFGTQIQNPGYVPNGASCGNNLMCYNNSCKSVSDFLTIMPCSATCSDNGICNNKGNCQCLNGLAYPQCSGNIVTLQTLQTTTTVITTTKTTTTTTTTTSIQNNGHRLRSLTFLIYLSSFLCLQLM